MRALTDGQDHKAAKWTIDRVETPSRFVVGESNCCARHKAGARLRTVS